MTEYKLCVVSRFGNTHRISTEANNAFDAVKDIFWWLNACHWRSYTCWNRKEGNTYIRVEWKTIGKDGSNRDYIKYFTCERLEKFDEMCRYSEYRTTMDDLNNILIGREFVYAMYKSRDTDEIVGLFTSKNAAEQWFDDRQHDEYRYKYVLGHEWIHSYDDEKDLESFLKNFKEKEE